MTPTLVASRWGTRTSIIALGAVAIMVTADMVGDSRIGADTFHLVMEGAMVLLTAVGLAGLWARASAARRAGLLLEQRLVTACSETERWRREAGDALAGLGVAIDRQFARWALTPAEREVGLLLLKGLSFKQVAVVRSASERTVRQQALAIYRKAGLEGRATLSAFFLEDLLLPKPNAAPATKEAQS